MLVALAGFLAGFLSSIPPMGPIAIMVLRRGLLRAYAAGFALAVGSAVAESVYALLAIFGLDALMRAFPALTGALRLAGVVLLAGLGIYFALTSQTPPMDEAPEPEDVSAAGWTRELFVGFTVALLNPTLPLTWTAGVAMVIAFVDVELGLAEKIAFPLAVAIGIAAWFGLLLLGLRRWGRLIPPRIVDLVVRGLGVALTLAAMWLGYSMWVSGALSMESAGL